MLFALVVISLWAMVHFTRKELEFRRLVREFCGQRYKDLPLEERQQYRADYERHLKEAKDAEMLHYYKAITGNGDPDRPPRMYHYGVGGSTNLPNPEYIAWHIRKYGCEPKMRRDDSYDGFLE